MPTLHTIRSGVLSLLATLLVLEGCAATPAQPPAQQTALAPAVSAKSASSHEPMAIEVDQRDGNCHIRLDGYLDEYAARSLRQVMTNLEKASCRSKRVLIDLDGGLVGSAFTVGAIIKNRGFDTQVQPGSTCLTPCLLVFAAGRQRILLPSVPPTRIGFSQIPPDEDFGHRVCETELSPVQTMNLRRYLRAMLPVPVANTVLKKIGAATCEHAEYVGPNEAFEIGLATAIR